VISQTESKRLIDLAIAHAAKRADGVEVRVTSSDFATSRFANNNMTQNQAPEHVTVSVRVIAGQRQLRLSTDNISDSGIEHLVDNAITAVKLLPEDPTVLPLPDLTLTNCTIEALNLIATTGAQVK
jgi:predicted Zn-dependent protease